MNKYHIKITNNKTKEVLLDSDSNCILGAVADETGVEKICFISCNGFTLACSASIVEEILDRCKDLLDGGNSNEN